MDPASLPSTAAAYDLLAERWLDGQLPANYGVPQHARALAFLTAHEGWALSVGCGCSTRFNALLRAAGLQIEGIDVSARMIALARAADTTMLLHHADACTWEPPRRYRFISAWDSLWHVPLGQQRDVMLKLMRALEPGGVFIFSTGGTDAPAEHVDSAMGPELYYATPGIPALLALVQEGGSICRHLEFDQHPERHLYLVVQRA